MTESSVWPRFGQTFFLCQKVLPLLFVRKFGQTSVELLPNRKFGLSLKITKLTNYLANGKDEETERFFQKDKTNTGSDLTRTQ